MMETGRLWTTWWYPKSLHPGLLHFGLGCLMTVPPPRFFWATLIEEEEGTVLEWHEGSAEANRNTPAGEPRRCCQRPHPGQEAPPSVLKPHPDRKLGRPSPRGPLMQTAPNPRTLNAMFLTTAHH